MKKQYQFQAINRPAFAEIPIEPVGTVGGILWGILQLEIEGSDKPEETAALIAKLDGMAGDKASGVYAISEDQYIVESKKKTPTYPHSPEWRPIVVQPITPAPVRVAAEIVVSSKPVVPVATAVPEAEAPVATSIEDVTQVGTVLPAVPEPEVQPKKPKNK